MKTCTRCNQEKELAEFNKKASSKDGHCEACRECMKLVKRAAYQENRESILAQQKAYKEANREKVLQSQRATYYRYRDRILEENRTRYYENREARLAADKARRDANREEWLAKEKRTRERLAEKRAANQRSYYAANKEARAAYKLDYDKARRKRDPLFALAHTVRRRITIALSGKGFAKTSRTHEMLGCSFEHLFAHLESKFQPGMTWGNRGAEGWHVDHIIPLASAKNEEELIKLCHYTNLQPLWAADNLAKGARA